MDSDGEATALVNSADEGLERRGPCRAFDKAYRTPIASTSAAPAPKRKLEEGLQFAGDATAAHAPGVLSESSPLIPPSSSSF